MFVLRDPFERSMAYWLLKDYARAAHTLVEEANSLVAATDFSLSNIFNFYNFLRKHPLVIRQRLTDAGVQVPNFFLLLNSNEGQVQIKRERLRLFWFTLLLESISLFLNSWCKKVFS